MSSGFQNKWIVVSGASSGMGQAIAIALSEQGANLVLLGRQLTTLEATAEKLPGACKTVALDLVDLEGIQTALLPVLGTIAGGVYGLCHCAGVVETRPLSASKPQLVQHHMQVNLAAGLELARTVCRRDVMAADGGSLLFMSSIYNQVGAPGQIAYCASKGALTAAAKAMAVELAPRKIRANTLSPGFVKTEMTTRHARLTPAQLDAIVARHPLGAGSLDDVARAALFLLDPANAWITGTDLVVDGGYTAL